MMTHAGFNSNEERMDACYDALTDKAAELRTDARRLFLQHAATRSDLHELDTRYVHPEAFADDCDACDRLELDAQTAFALASRVQAKADALATEWSSR